MENLLSTQRTMSANNIFGSRYIDSKALYMYHFNKLPSVNYIGYIDGEKAYTAFHKEYAHLIANIHRYRCYKRKSKQFDFDETIVLLTNECIVEFDDDYCEILHNGLNDEFVKVCTELVERFKPKQRRLPLEINLIVKEPHGLDLKGMEVKRMKLDLDLYYDNDFLLADAVIKQRLNRKNDKGIVLLHGLPGTGKTTYLRYLIGKIKKKVLFLSPNLAGDLISPDFVDLLIDNPNSVIIIEDAENIITDRKLSGSSAVSNLLNISDGLLADFLNVQLICTFNSSLTLVDEALMRKGRLIAKYEFGRLSISKAQKLSKHLGYETIVTRPMTLAEISNQNETSYEKKQVNVIGFRRETILEN